MECVRMSERSWARVEFRVYIKGELEVEVNQGERRGRRMLVEQARLTYEPGDSGRWECKAFLAEGKVLALTTGKPTNMAAESLYAPWAALPGWAERTAEYFRPREPVPVVPLEPFRLDLEQVPG